MLNVYFCASKAQVISHTNNLPTGITFKVYKLFQTSQAHLFVGRYVTS